MDAWTEHLVVGQIFCTLLYSKKHILTVNFFFWLTVPEEFHKLLPDLLMGMLHGKLFWLNLVVVHFIGYAYHLRKIKLETEINKEKIK